jgi:hypothetical protein
MMLCQWTVRSAAAGTDRASASCRSPPSVAARASQRFASRAVLPVRARGGDLGRQPPALAGEGALLLVEQFRAALRDREPVREPRAPGAAGRVADLHGASPR